MQLRPVDVLHILSVVGGGWLAWKAFSNKRWIRINGLLSIGLLYFAAPAFKIAVKSVGFNVDAAWNDGFGAKDVVAGLLILVLGTLEFRFMGIERERDLANAHQKYVHEFKTVVVECLGNNLTDLEVARQVGIPVEKAQAILICAALAGEWAENNQE